MINEGHLYNALESKMFGEVRVSTMWSKTNGLVCFERDTLGVSLGVGGRHRTQCFGTLSVLKEVSMQWPACYEMAQCLLRVPWQTSGRTVIARVSFMHHR